MKQFLQEWRLQNHLMVLDIRPDGFRLLELKKQWDKLTCVQGLEKPLFISKKPGPAYKRELLAGVLREVDLSNRKIAVRLPAESFRHVFDEVDENFTGDAHAWATQNLERFLPPGLRPEQVAYECHLFYNERHADRALLTLARTEEIADWLAALQALNLEITGLSGSLQPVLNAVSFLDAGFHSKNVAVVHLGKGRVSIFYCERGDVRDFREVPVNAPQTPAGKVNDNPVHLTDLFDEIERLRTDFSFDQILFTGPLAQAKVTAERINETLADGLLHEFLPGQPSGEDVHLLGLGLQSFYPELGGKDLLPETTRQQLNEQREKLQTVNLAAAILLVLFILSSVLLGIAAYADRQLLMAKQEMTVFETQIKQIATLKETRTRLTSELSLKKTVINRKSNLARLLFDLSQTMPEQVWLRTIRWRGETEASAHAGEAPAVPILLEGLAISERGPTNLLARLEKQASLTRVHLDAIQTIPAKRVFQKTRLRKIPLYRFKMSVQAGG